MYRNGFPKNPASNLEQNRSRHSYCYVISRFCPSFFAVFPGNSIPSCNIRVNRYSLSLCQSLTHVPNTFYTTLCGIFTLQLKSPKPFFGPGTFTKVYFMACSYGTKSLAKPIIIMFKSNLIKSSSTFMPSLFNLVNQN